MYSVFAPVFWSYSRRSLAMNSGPLSDRICSGNPRWIIASASTSIRFRLSGADDYRMTQVLRSISGVPRREIPVVWNPSLRYIDTKALGARSAGVSGLASSCAIR